MSPRRRPGLILNQDLAPDTTTEAKGMPETRGGRKDGGCSLGLCVLAPLCVASLALLWEGLYAHRDRTEFARRADSPLDAPYWETKHGKDRQSSS